jgi:hypothetical protein
MQNIDENQDLTFNLTEDQDGFIVHYVNENGNEIWSEFYESLEQVRTVYRKDIAAGRFII